jgi:hypothetical protein
VLYLEAAAPFHAAELELRYDPARLRLRGVRPLRAGADIVLAAHASVPGRLHVALASAHPLPPGPLLLLDAAPQGAAAARSLEIRATRVETGG